jgi:hypothetical protein
MARRANFGEVELHHRHVGGREPLSQVLDSTWVKLDSEHSRASGHEFRGDCSVACAEVQEEFARADVGILDDRPCPLLNEAMPGPTSPRPRGGGHGEPSV